MLNLWRRHLRSCPYSRKPNPRKWKGCKRPIWVQGSLHGEWMKKALSVRDWNSAQELVCDWSREWPIALSLTLPIPPPPHELRIMSTSPLYSRTVALL